MIAVEMRTELMRRVAARLVSGDVPIIEPVGGGRNSQVYRLVGADSRIHALKAYFRDTSGDRDRLRTEFSSLCFLWENGIRDIPQPLAADWDQGCALYEYIEGQKIAVHAVTGAEVDAAVLFLTRLKDLRGRPGSRDLATAAEACFSVRAIVESIQGRLSRLTDKCSGEESYADLYEFLDHHLAPKLREIVRWSQEGLSRAHLSFDLDIHPTERTLSPSDFGFHNAIKRSNGQVAFLDFEYFGWDDPAKMVVDVLLHPGMNLAHSLKRRFVHGILQTFVEYPHLAQRVEIVYPLFGLKWCLILLNEFLPEHLLRRRFASTNGFQRHTLQAEQLAKAKRLLETIGEEYEHFPYFD